MWDTHEELRERLKNRILAVIGEGPERLRLSASSTPPTTTLTEADVEGSPARLARRPRLADSRTGPYIGPGGPAEEGANYGAVALERRLRGALARPGGVPATV